MTNILRSLIGKSRNKPAAEEAEALQRATQVLQFRVAQLSKPAVEIAGKEAA